MCMNWLVPFVVGVFVGQEMNNVPKVKPYVTDAAEKFMAFVKDLSDKQNENKKK